MRVVAFSIVVVPLTFKQKRALSPYAPPQRSAIAAERRTSRRLAPRAGVSLSSGDGGDESPQVTAQRSAHPTLSAINESTKWVVSAAVFGMLAARRDLVCAWWVLGSVLAAAFCRFLKLAINQSRPPTARKKDPGMPSSHANSLGYLSTFVALWSSQAAALQGSMLSWAAVAAVPAAGLFLTWLRVALCYHTLGQVTVGWLLGASVAAGWFLLGRDVAIPAVVASTELQARLYGATGAAVAFFIFQNVRRWFAELRGGH